jgi:hypothetical protein
MTNYKRKLSRQQYKAAHPLLRFRKISPHVLEFVKDSLVPGSILSVDSFPWALKINADCVYELTMFKHLFKKTQKLSFLRSMTDLPSNVNFDNLILCGISEFKYKNWSEAVDTVVHFSNRSQHRIIVALPITVLFFHRLEHTYNDIIHKISQQFEQNGLVCENQLFDIDIVYFSLRKK